MTVARRALRSAIWMFAESWIGLIWGFVSLAILARILGPDVFGVLAIAGIVLGVGGIFLGDTLTQGIRQFENLENGHCNAAFWLNLFLGTLFTLIISFLAAPIAVFFDLPVLAQLLPILAIIALIGTLGDVSEALLEREFEHNKVISIEAAFGFPSSVLTIGLALSGFGVWSFVISSGIATVLTTIALFWKTDWRPSFEVNRSHYGDTVRFARDTGLLVVLDEVESALPRFAIGYFLGERALGLYSMAMKLAGQLSGLIMGPLSELAMVVVARLQTDPEQLRNTLSRVFNATTFVMYPAMLGACFLAPIAAPFILGNKWSGVELPLIIALLVGFRHATGDFNISILRGLGDTKTPLYILSIGVVILAFLLPFGLQFGLAGVMAIVALRIFATWPLSAWFVQRRSGYPMRDQFTIGWRSLICALIMALSLAVLTWAGVWSAWSALEQMAFVAVIGSTVYLSLYAILWPNRLRVGLAQLRLMLEDSSDEAPIEVRHVAAN